MRRRRAVVLTVFAVATGLIAGCAGNDDAPGADGGDADRGELVVFAASTLADAVDDLAAAFTTAHPDVGVTTSLAGSQMLAGQILDGAPADVFVSADWTRMREVADAGLVDGDPVEIATNQLVIAVEPGNPHGIGGLDDLAREGLVVALAAPEVPAGAYAARALEAAGVEVAPATLEASVRAVLAKVELGEADAGIVYASDVRSAPGRVEGVAVPAAVDPRPVLPAAVLTEARSPATARAFVAFLGSSEGRAVLAYHGFGPP